MISKTASYQPPCPEQGLTPLGLFLCEKMRLYPQQHFLTFGDDMESASQRQLG
jgi:hypothetical protein